MSVFGSRNGGGVAWVMIFVCGLLKKNCNFSPRIPQEEVT